MIIATEPSMRSITTGLLLLVLVVAPAAAQSRLYTNADLARPLSATGPTTPAEAVRILRTSHSPYDVTDVPFYGANRMIGPEVVIAGHASSGPWDWPAEAYEPIRPLSEPWSSSMYLPWQGFYPYVPSAAPVVTVSPWSMSAYLGPSPAVGPLKP